ncbi:MAG: hypothetical protein U0U69_10380 [Acidimicrobiia bacterium]
MPLVEHPLRQYVRLLFTVALALFVFTVVVGILNGADLVNFDQKALLTHVHVGTLGWITMSVFASSLWLFGRNGVTGVRRALVPVLALTGAGAIVGYSLTFLLTTGIARPILGTLTVVTILGFFVWTCLQVPQVRPLAVPHVGYLAALATSVTGGVLGVLLGIMIATGRHVLPVGGEGAHPGTMVIGFLVPVGMATIEWWLASDRATAPATRGGWWQIGLPFAGGIAIMLGLLLAVPPLLFLSLPFEIAGIVILFKRMWPHLRSVNWSEPTPARLAAAAAIFLAVDIAYIAGLVIAYEGNFDDTPPRLLLALDHIMFVGVLTNAIFGLLTGATAGRARAGWIDEVVFWAVQVGLVLFVAGLLADSAMPKRMGTPIMGLGILVGIATYLLRLYAPERSAAPV